MTVSEIMPTLRDLDRADKLRVVQFLVTELAQEESALLTEGMSYPLWSQYDAYEAAETLQTVLETDRKARNAHG